MTYKNILILGSSGRTGKYLLQLALDEGYEVHVLVRNVAKVEKHSRLHIFEGTPTDTIALSKAMEGCDAIMSALNISRNSDFPWSKLRTLSDFLSATAANIIRLAPQFRIDRIIVLSAWGVGNSRTEIPGWFGWFIDHSNIGVAYKDHDVQEKLFASSSLRYTILRPVGLTNFKKPKNVIVSFNNSPRPNLTISRMDVAKFMLSALNEDSYIRQMPVIST